MKMRAIFFGLGFTIAANCGNAAPAELKIATWNLEWFMKPETLRALTPACTPRDAPRDGARRTIPCDVAHELARSGEDIAALRSYANDLLRWFRFLQVAGLRGTERNEQTYAISLSGRGI